MKNADMQEISQKNDWKCHSQRCVINHMSQKNYSATDRHTWAAAAMENSEACPNGCGVAVSLERRGIECLGSNSGLSKCVGVTLRGWLLTKLMYEWDLMINFKTTLSPNLVSQRVACVGVGSYNESQRKIIGVGKFLHNMEWSCNLVYQMFRMRRLQ